MIRTSQAILYSDREDEKMVRVRKRRFLIDPFVAAGLLSLEVCVVVGLISRSSPGFQVDSIALIAVGSFGACVLIALFVWNDIGYLREGVELSESSLHFSRRVILVASIRRAAIVSFTSSTGGFVPALVIDYDIGSGLGGPIRTRFWYEGVTKDLLRLTNAIRVLKGWSPQVETVSCRWKDWKASRGEAGMPPAA